MKRHRHKEEKKEDWLLSHNFQYDGVEYSYDTEYACQNGSDCCKDDYCRCGVIRDTHVTEINSSQILEYIFKNESEENKYCIERILSNLTDDDFEVKTSGGYYGEEIDGVYLTNKDVAENINKVMALSSLKEKVLFVLNLEYNFLLPELKKCDKWTIETVLLDQIDSHYMARKTKKKIENNYKLPLGVCLRKDGRFRLIDGHHRIEKAVKDEREWVMIVVGE